MGRSLGYLTLTAILLLNAPTKADDWSWNGLHWGMSPGEAAAMLQDLPQRYPDYFQATADGIALGQPDENGKRSTGLRMTGGACILEVSLAFDVPTRPLTSGLGGIRLDSPATLRDLPAATHNECEIWLTGKLHARYGGPTTEHDFYTLWHRRDAFVQLFHIGENPPALLYETPHGVPDLF